MSIRVSDRLLIRLTLGWLAALAVIPWLHPRQATFVASLALALASTAYTLRTLTRERRVPVALNFVQVLLFAVLNYQLYVTYGEEHYVLERDPGFFDWTEFAVAHVFRAADLVDAIDEYGIDLQSIHHGSVFAGLLIVGMHVCADVFLIGLVLRWWAKLRRSPRENLLARRRRHIGWLFLTVSIYVFIGLLYRFEGFDWILWPMDNVLRLFDIGDAFQVFRWRLHRVEPGIIGSSASLGFRIAFGGWTTDILLWLHFSFLRAWGMQVEKLQEILQDGDSFARQGAARALGDCGRRAKCAVDDLIDALSDYDIDVRCEAARALGKIGPRAARAVSALALLLWSDHRKVRLAAAEGLDGLGDAAEEVVPDLIYLMVVGEEPLKKIAGRTLYRFGYVPKEAAEREAEKPARSNGKKGDAS